MPELFHPMLFKIRQISVLKSVPPVITCERCGVQKFRITVFHISFPSSSENVQVYHLNLRNWLIAKIALNKSYK